MEIIKFRIISIGDNMCRIVSQDIRSIYKNIADGSCICSMEIMFAEVQHIKEEVENLGNEAVFII